MNLWFRLTNHQQCWPKSNDLTRVLQQIFNYIAMFKHFWAELYTHTRARLHLNLYLHTFTYVYVDRCCVGVASQAVPPHSLKILSILIRIKNQINFVL